MARIINIDKRTFYLFLGLILVCGVYAVAQGARNSDYNFMGYGLLNATVQWDNINDSTYPVACPADSAITELGDSVTCTAYNVLDELNASEINEVLYVQAGNASDIYEKIDDCPSNGCEIRLPCGTYNIGNTTTDGGIGTIQLKSGVKLIGSGMGCTFINVTNYISYPLSDASSAGNAIVSALHNDSTIDYNVTLSDFTILANNNSQGITFRKCDGCIINNVKVFDSNSNCLYITTSNSENNVIDSFWCYNPYKSGLYLDTVKENIFKNVFIYNTLKNDGLIVRQSNDNIFNIFIIDNVGAENATYGNGVRLLDDSTQNIFDNFKISNAERCGVRLNSNHNNTFSNFQIENTTIYGLYVKEGMYNQFQTFSFKDCNRSLSIQGDYNIFSNIKIMNDVGSEGVLISSDSPASGSGNIINGINVFGDNTNMEYGIEINSGSENNTIIVGTINGFTSTEISDSGTDNKIITDDITGFNLDWDYVENNPISNSEDLLGYWSLDENMGSTAYDSSRNYKDGDINGSTTWIKGKIGSGLDLDGSGDFINITTGAITTRTDNFTLGGWVYIENAVQSYLIYNGDDSGGYGIGVGSGGDFAGLFGGQAAFSSGFDPLLNTWYHLILVRDNGVARIFVNGSQEGSNYTAKSPNTPNNYLEIGHEPGRADRYFNGVIDEVKIWNRSLTDEEIQAEYILGISSHVPSGHLLNKINQEYDITASRPTASEGVCYWNTTAGYKCQQCYNGTNWEGVCQGAAWAE